MDEMIEIVEVVCSITQERIPERIAEQIAARTCRKEQTVEAMKMITQEVSKHRETDHGQASATSGRSRMSRILKTTQQVVNRGGNSTDFGARRG